MGTQQKSYYLKGYPSPQGVKRTSDYPLRGVDSPALFEFWLSPDHSDASLEQIFGRIPDIYEKENIRGRFRNVVIDYFPEEGSLFDGFEAKLYKQLVRTRCRRDVEYVGCKTATYLQICISHFNEASAVINRTLFADRAKVNECDIPLLMMPEFLDAYDCSYLGVIEGERQHPYYPSRKEPGEHDDSRIRQVLRCRAILAAPENFHAIQRDLASRIIDGLSALDLNEELRNLLASCG